MIYLHACYIGYYKLPEKILRHVTSILMHILIKFSIKNDRFILRNNDVIAARLLW